MTGVLCRAIKAIRTFWMILKNPEAQTYYPEEERKNRFRIFCDNLLWLFKYHEINHYYYLYGFDRKKETARDSFIPKRKIFTIQAKTNGPVTIGNRKIFYGCLLQDKFVFSQYLQSLNLPLPRMLGLGDPKLIYWLNDKQRKPLESFCEKGDIDVFVKPILGDSGKGVLSVIFKNNILKVNGQEVVFSELSHFLSDKYVIQERIEQSSELNTLCTDTVASLRIITAWKDGRPQYVSSLLTVGMKQNTMSNWFAGGVTVGIDCHTGRLNKYAFYKPEFGRKITHHPDTGIAFEGFTLPFYKEAVELALKAHYYFYGTHSIGWDMAITPSGPVFIEGNNLWGMGSLQANDHKFVRNYLASLPKK